MVQEIIVWIIIGMAIFYSVYSLIKTIRSKPSSDCGTNCCGCDAKKQITKQLDYKNMRVVARSQA